MGLFFEAIEGLVDITKDFVIDMVDLSKSTGESFRHLDDENYKTSYEIRDEAKKVIQKADSKWYKKTECLERKLAIVEKTIAENRKEEANLFFAVRGKKAEEVISDLREMEAPSFRAKEDFEFASILGFLGDKMRMDAAREYLEDAKQYRTVINGKIAQLERIEADLDVLLQKRKEEKEALSVQEENSDQ